MGTIPIFGAGNCFANAGKYALTFEIERPIANYRRDLLQITANGVLLETDFRPVQFLCLNSLNA